MIAIERDGKTTPEFRELLLGDERVEVHLNVGSRKSRNGLVYNRIALGPRRPS